MSLGAATRHCPWRRWRGTLLRRSSKPSAAAVIRGTATPSEAAPGSFPPPPCPSTRPSLAAPSVEIMNSSIVGGGSQLVCDASSSSQRLSASPHGDEGGGGGAPAVGVGRCGEMWGDAGRYGGWCGEIWGARISAASRLPLGCLSAASRRRSRSLSSSASRRRSGRGSSRGCGVAR